MIVWWRASFLSLKSGDGMGKNEVHENKYIETLSFPVSMSKTFQ